MSRRNRKRRVVSTTKDAVQTAKTEYADLSLDTNRELARSCYTKYLALSQCTGDKCEVHLRNLRLSWLRSSIVASLLPFVFDRESSPSRLESGLADNIYIFVNQQDQYFKALPAELLEVVSSLVKALDMIAFGGDATLGVDESEIHSAAKQCILFISSATA